MTQPDRIQNRARKAYANRSYRAAAILALLANETIRDTGDEVVLIPSPSR